MLLCQQLKHREQVISSVSARHMRPECLSRNMMPATTPATDHLRTAGLRILTVVSMANQATKIPILVHSVIRMDLFDVTLPRTDRLVLSPLRLQIVLPPRRSPARPQKSCRCQVMQYRRPWLVQRQHQRLVASRSPEHCQQACQGQSYKQMRFTYPVER